jgi:transcriptional regulator with XRE-family HTH domain
MRHRQLEDAADRAVFGTNDAGAIRRKVAEMARQLELEESSLGLSLLGLRNRDNLTFREVALKAQVAESTWKAWESDLKTPTADELRQALKHLEWSGMTEQFLKLREKAPRVKLRRLTTMQPTMLAARGAAGVSQAYEWQALDPELQAQLQAWGAGRGYTFPEDLIAVLADLADNDERETWMDEVLGG